MNQAAVEEFVEQYPKLAKAVEMMFEAEVSKAGIMQTLRQANLSSEQLAVCGAYVDYLTRWRQAQRTFI